MYLDREHIYCRWDGCFRLYSASKRVYLIGVFLTNKGGLVVGWLGMNGGADCR